MKLINGSEFKSMIINGGNNLFNYYPEIDALNVFPVPDGDTGTNMNLTYSSGVKEISNMHSTHIGDVSKAFSRGLLMGARGNSGVILSQIFKGISLELTDKESVDSVELAKAFVKGRKTAYKAVMRPVEGTILTVIKDSSEHVLKEVKHSHTIKETMNKLVNQANLSLENTPNLLPILKEANVVDSGGAGLVRIFEGMLAYLNDDLIEKSSQDLEVEKVATEYYIDNHEGKYGYCTEYIVRLNEPDKFNETELREFLEEQGDSLVVVNDEDILKVHVHTLDPGKALSNAITYGDLLKIKIENMQEQADNNESFKPVKSKEQAIIAVSSGEGINHMFYDLHVDHIITGGQTMNPSTKDFIKAINKIKAEKIIILPNNSNIILAAQQAKEVVKVMKDIKIEVIETKTIMQGIVSCINFNPDSDYETNVTMMKEALNTIKSGEVTYAIKNTVFGGHKIKKNDFMGIYEKDVVVSDKDLVTTTTTLLAEMINEGEDELVTLIKGNDVSDEQAQEVIQFIDDNYDLEVELNDGKQALYSFYIGVE